MYNTTIRYIFEKACSMYFSKNHIYSPTSTSTSTSFPQLELSNINYSPQVILEILIILKVNTLKMEKRKILFKTGIWMMILIQASL